MSGEPGLGPPGGRGPSPGKGAPDGNWSVSWPPGPGLKGIRGGRDIGSGCSMEVGGPGHRESYMRQRLGTMGSWGEINALTMTQDTSQELECQAWEPGVMHVPAEEGRGDKKVERLDQTQDSQELRVPIVHHSNDRPMTWRPA